MNRNAKEMAEMALVGAAIAEAMGTPWEPLTRERILELTEGEGVTGFRDPGVRDPAWGVFALGETGDDSQLTYASAQSLISCAKFDIEDIARRTVNEMRRSSAGWGPTTKEGLEEIGLWFDTSGREGRSPYQFVTPREGRGIGNGVMSRVLPHAISHAAVCSPLMQRRRDDLKTAADRAFRQEILQLGKMTHGDLRASIAAYALADIYAQMLLSESTNPHHPDGIIWHALIWVRDMELDFRGTDSPSISSLMERVLELDERDRDAPLREFGSDCAVTSSLPFILGTWRVADSYRDGVLMAINAGGDTDSNAAMVGALCAMQMGVVYTMEQQIPRDWIGFHPSYLQMGDLARPLLRTRRVDR